MKTSIPQNFELTHNGKLSLLVGHIQQLQTGIYLERVKRKMVNKKALTSGDREFGVLQKQLTGRINAMEDERDHFISEYDLLLEKQPSAE